TSTPSRPTEGWHRTDQPARAITDQPRVTPYRLVQQQQQSSVRRTWACWPPPWNIAPTTPAVRPARGSRAARAANAPPRSHSTGRLHQTAASERTPQGQPGHAPDSTVGPG